MDDKLLDFHEQELQKAEIPKWINVDCPFCHEKLPLRSIRSISLKLNTRNMGDIVLEIFCPYCSRMDDIYYREGVEKLSDFISFLNGKKSPCSNPILEEDMYKMNCNNVVEKMISQQNRSS